MFLCGKYPTQLDDKNRIRLPARLRAALGDKYILLPGMDGCVYIIKEDEPQAILDVIMGSESTNPEKENMLRTLVSEGSNVEADSQGRFTLPQNLKDYAGVDKDLMIVGNISKVEVWSKQAWDAREVDKTPQGVNRLYSALSSKPQDNQ